MEKIGYIEKISLKQSLPECFHLNDTNIAKTELLYDARDTVENSAEYVQPIPVLVITNKSKDKILVVKKNKSSSKEKSPEADKLLVYLGGHSRKEDGFGRHDKDLFSITRLSLKREVKEEIGLNYSPSSEQDNPLCLWVRDNERSKKHIALVYIHEVDETSMKLKLDRNEFIVAPNTKSGKFMKISDLSKRQNDLENWSKIILREYFGVDFSKSERLI